MQDFDVFPAPPVVDEIHIGHVEQVPDAIGFVYEHDYFEKTHAVDHVVEEQMQHEYVVDLVFHLDEKPGYPEREHDLYGKSDQNAHQTVNVDVEYFFTARIEPLIKKK